ncbi:MULTISPECIES: MarR family winged helix-turn-helix transcriptional regulator [Phyllobacteriaceae]|jgi:DNA-binding MarR family transcriptional regulator|nr:MULTISPECIES: MarR family transcriptional regulator [Mesorhizobium]MDQ0330534.1 DNA-binding MarR family transcriptional regulator [Mesorhizobium sp. YL-MeA3-2017]
MSKSAELIAAIGGAVMRWQDETQSYDEAVRERLGINGPEGRCLSLLHRGPQSAGAIAVVTGLTPAAVTALIDRLEARGYVTRTRSLEDRRKVMVEATETTLRLSQRYYGEIAYEGQKLLGTFSDAELGTILEFMTAAADLQRNQLQNLKASATS